MRLRAAPLLWASCAASLVVSAQAWANSASDAIAQAGHDHLAEAATWRKLGHYKHAPFGALRSDVISPRFFLSEQGRADPRAELDATIAAMFAPVADNADDHAQCRFPARFMWLKQHLDLSGAPAIDCAKLHQWQGDQHINGLTLVLASGYLDNPSSFFGHVLLRFDTREGNALLDTTLNYGATYPTNENGLAYIVRGLTGQYSSQFTELDYFQYDSRYSEEQLRDSWEYELALPQSDVDFVVAHAWELMTASNHYFFLRQNCAFHMAELVNLVVDDPLLPTSKIWALPPDVFGKAADAKMGDAPLVSRVTHEPSRQSRLREHYFALSPEARGDVRLYVADHAAGLRQIQQRAIAQQQQTLETLIDYYTYLGANQEMATPDVRAATNEVLLTRMRLPAGEGQAPAPVLAPHQGQGSTMLQVAGVARDGDKAAFDVRFRAAYYDFLTATAGTLPYSELAMLDVTLRLDDGDVDLQRLDAVRITTLNVSGTDLPHDGKGHAWRLRFGAEQADLSCETCLVGFVDGGFGKAWRMGAAGAVYAFADGRLTTSDDADTNVLAGASVGAVFGPPRVWRANVEAGALQPLNGDDDVRPYAHAEVRLGSNARWDVRLGADYQRAEGNDSVEGKVALDFYW